MHDEIISIFRKLKLPTQSQLDMLTMAGVSPTAIIWNWAGDPAEIRRAFVEWLPNNRFVFEADSRSGVVFENLVVIANDECGEVADIVAFDVQGHFASWLGIPILGLENSTMPRISDALPLHKSVTEWIRSYRKGVVILEPSKARHFLENSGSLVVDDLDYGRRLMAAMTWKPSILISRYARQAA